MNRSVLAAYVFVLLVISYLGGILLYRRTPAETSAAILNIIDARVFLSTDLPFWKILLPTVILYVLVIFFASHPWLYHITLLVGASRIVFFGFTSGFLIEQQSSIVPYAIWWFPFQLISSLLLLLFCFIVSPPFFISNKFFFNRNKVMLSIGIVAFVVIIIEMFVYRIVLI